MDLLAEGYWIGVYVDLMGEDVAGGQQRGEYQEVSAALREGLQEDEVLVVVVPAALHYLEVVKGVGPVVLQSVLLAHLILLYPHHPVLLESHYQQIIQAEQGFHLYRVEGLYHVPY